MTDRSGPLAALGRALVGWGVWPACVMALAQLELARLATHSFPAHLTRITLAGTLTVYGADRWVERRSLSHLGARHRASRIADSLFLAAITALAVTALPLLSLHEWLWLALLGVLGALYLAITTGKLLRPSVIKELLGAACFTVLVWALAADVPASLLTGIMLLGLANFLWSGHQDRARDAANQLATLAVTHPTATIITARLTAFVAIAVLISAAGPNLFAACALILAFWPTRAQLSIDLCFLPLLAWFWLPPALL